MYDTYDLGGTPANEPCAQLGHTEDFSRINRLEVECYRAAITARFGPPPEGCTLVVLTNQHDFGTYYTLGLKVWQVARNEAVDAYVAEVEDGLGSWIEAGFTAPVRCDDGHSATAPRSLDEVVLGAMMTTRPGPDGTFPVADFELLHGNLAASFPQIAAEAKARLEQVPA